MKYFEVLHALKKEQRNKSDLLFGIIYNINGIKMSFFMFAFSNYADQSVQEWRPYKNIKGL